MSIIATYNGSGALMLNQVRASGFYAAAPRPFFLSFFGLLLYLPLHILNHPNHDISPDSHMLTPFYMKSSSSVSSPSRFWGILFVSSAIAKAIISLTNSSPRFLLGMVCAPGIIAATPVSSPTGALELLTCTRTSPPTPSMRTLCVSGPESAAGGRVMGPGLACTKFCTILLS